MKQNVDITKIMVRLRKVKRKGKKRKGKRTLKLCVGSQIWNVNYEMK